MCLFSLLALDELVQKYKPTAYKKPALRYDGNMWAYHANVVGMVYDGGGLGINKNLNKGVKDCYAHYVYHFPPFAQHKMMYDHEIAICADILRNIEPSDRNKESISNMIAAGYLRKDAKGKIAVSMPVFSATQYRGFKVLLSEAFESFMPYYLERIQSYMQGYIKVFPAHLRDAANRNGFYLFVAMFSKVASIWLEQGKIHIPQEAVCDILIAHE